MKSYSIFLLSFALCLCVSAQSTKTQEGSTKKTTMNEQKQIVTRWYTAFDQKNPEILDEVLASQWVDIPPAPDQLPGSAGAKQILLQLGTTFPDFRIKIEDILEDGNKVVVRSTITGTQKGPLSGFPAKDRTMTIQAVDIHEIKNGKIVRTWHTEDWMTGLHQLGVFDK
jgi:steroid delta-isomerase-like uncharacterized protein